MGALQCITGVGTGQHCSPYSAFPLWTAVGVPPAPTVTLVQQLCAPQALGDCRLKFSGCPENRCQKNLQTFISYLKGAPCSHLHFPYFLGSHRGCSLFAGHCSLLLFRGCTAAPGLAEMLLLLLGRSRGIPRGSKECCRAVLLQELQLETELGKLQQLLPWPLPPPSALPDNSDTIKMFNPIFPLARNALRNPFQRFLCSPGRCWGKLVKCK